MAEHSHATEFEMANAIRALSMDAVQAANSGHPGMPMGMAAAATVLFNRFVNIDPSAPDWPDRDRFVLSAGHGSMLQYSILHLLGFDDMPIEQIKSFRQIGSRTAGHPEYGHAKGVETTTGPLGQGIGAAVGMALAERMMNARFGDSLVDHWTYTIAGDGCLMEGVSHEAIDLAGHLKLGRLIVLWDDNEITIDGSTSLATSMDQCARFEAAGWHVVRGIDGSDHDAIAKAIEEARADDRPSMIACRTVIGYGAPNKQGTAAAHGSPLGPDEIALARAQLNWSHEAFHVPDDVYAAWHAIADRGGAARNAWEGRLSGDASREAFEGFLAGPDMASVRDAIRDHKRKLSEEQPKKATRQASQMALEVINETIPHTIGGSADLTGSNNTKTDDLEIVSAKAFGGRYIHYGVREHAMAAAMNGMAAHGGFVPYGGTFLVFTDYCRPSIRLSALMGLRVVYVMTHDSIGLGEDGPTHQPVEHLAALRAIPNLNVFRPADAVETAEAWEIAIGSKSTPSIIALTRQGVPTVRTEHSDENLTARGAYLLRTPQNRRDVTLIATGSEVELALAAADRLEQDGIGVAVVSAPCLDLFAEQDASYRHEVMGDGPRVAVEAGIADCWYRWIGSSGRFVGMNSFGASGPYQELYEKFGITAEAVVDAAKGVCAR
jgi:transketolase